MDRAQTEYSPNEILEPSQTGLDLWSFYHDRRQTSCVVESVLLNEYGKYGKFWAQYSDAF